MPRSRASSKSCAETARSPGSRRNGSRQTSPKMLPKPSMFRLKVWATWLALLALLAAGAIGLKLDFGLISQRLPFLIGLQLSPDGFLQGAALTVFVTAASMVFALALGVVAAL